MDDMKEVLKKCMDNMDRTISSLSLDVKLLKSQHQSLKSVKMENESLSQNCLMKDNMNDDMMNHLYGFNEDTKPSFYCGRCEGACLANRGKHGKIMLNVDDDDGYPDNKFDHG